MNTKKNLYTALLGAFIGLSALDAQAEQKLAVSHLANQQNIVAVTEAGKYLLLPVQDDAPEAKVGVISGNTQVGVMANVRLARERVDYYVPFSLAGFEGKDVKIDIQGMPADAACWKNMKLSDTFDLSNKEKHRPLYHHTPAYGWMNDPNGMFYKDGVWHLCFQHNPYGSVWGNLSWGHSTSTDLVHWKYEGDPVMPDAWGLIFSGSAVVDKDNTAGFGRDAIVAFYTSAKPTPWGDNQMQCLVYSTDGGKTFTKYENNPVLTSTERDFRDPKVFWYAPGKHWVMMLAVGQQMQIFSSKNLKEWKHESDFGLKQGAHGGVHQPVSHQDEMDGLRERPLRHRHFQQRSRRTLRGHGLDEQLAVCRHRADEAIPLGQHHSARPQPLPARRRPAAALRPVKGDGDGQTGEEQPQEV